MTQDTVGSVKMDEQKMLHIVNRLSACIATAWLCWILCLLT